MSRSCKALREARERGDTYYDNGKPCKYGHISKRYVSTMFCVECGRARGRRKFKGVKAHIHPFCTIWKAAKDCSSRGEFKKKYPQMHMAAHKRGIFKSVCSHMPAARTAPKWSLCKVYNLARQYSTQGEFIKNHSGAMDYAVSKGILPLITAHMERLNSDYDAVYIWGYADGADLVCKIGVTSQRLGMERIKSVSQKSGLPCEFVILAKSDKALDAERALKEIGQHEPLSGFNGATEFRRFKRQEFMEAYGVIYEHAN